MSEVTGLTLPSNNLEIASALHSFTEDILPLLVEQRNASFSRGNNEELAMETFEASYLCPEAEEEVGSQAAKADLELWIPGSRIQAWGEYNLLFNFKAAFTKRLANGLNITRTHALQLGFGSRPVGAALLEAAKLDTTTSINLTDAGRSESIKSTKKEFSIKTSTELGQRLGWAVHLLDVTINPEKYPKTQLRT